MLAEVSAAAGVDPESILIAVDGCGVVTFALSLERMAHAFSRLERLERGRKVADAMRLHPELIRGPGASDTELKTGDLAHVPVENSRGEVVGEMRFA